MGENSAQRTDRLLRYFIMGHFRADNPDHHLTTCPGASVSELDVSINDSGGDGPYTTMTATLHCPHGHRVAFTYGDWGDTARTLAETEERDERTGRGHA